MHKNVHAFLYARLVSESWTQFFFLFFISTRVQIMREKRRDEEEEAFKFKMFLSFLFERFIIELFLLDEKIAQGDIELTLFVHVFIDEVIG